MISVGDAVFGFDVKARQAESREAPAVNPSEEFLAEVSAEESLLARELETVMSRPPVRSASGDNRHSLAETAYGYEPIEPLSSADGEFSWTSEDDTPPSSAQTGRAWEADAAKAPDLKRESAPGNAALWLKRARRERAWEQFRYISAYVLAIVVGGLIVAATAYFVAGQHLDIIGLFALGASRIF